MIIGSYLSSLIEIATGKYKHTNRESETGKDSRETKYPDVQIEQRDNE